MAWSPSDITNLVDYWDARSGVETNAALDLDGSTQYLASASTASLSAGSGFYLSGWIYLDVGSATQAIATKRSSGGTTMDWDFYITGANRLRGVLWISGGGSVGVSHGTTLTVGSWTFVEMWWDGSDLYVNINRGTPASVAAAITPASNSSPIWFGQGASSSAYLNGAEQSFGFWSAVPSDTIKNTLYSAGAGLLYSDLTGTETASLVSFWDFSEYSGTRSDCHGSIDLTAFNSPLARYGHIQSGVSCDGSVVRAWTGTENAVGYGQASLIARNPLWYSNGGDSYVDFDGAAHYLLTGSGWSSLNSSYTFGFRLDSDSATDPQVLHDYNSTNALQIILNSTYTPSDTYAYYDGIGRNSGQTMSDAEIVLVYHLDNSLGEGKFYVDGTKVGSTTTYVGGSTSTGEKRLGRTRTNTDEFNGKLYRFCIADEALSTSDRENLELYLDDTFSESVTDSVSVADSQAIELLLERALADSIAVADSDLVEAAFVRSLSDSATVADSHSYLRGRSQSVTDNVTVADSDLVEAAFDRSFSEGITAADVVATAADFVRSIADAAGVSDAELLEAAFERSLSDSLTVSDTAALAAEYARTLAESINADDVTATAALFVVTLAESVASGDADARVMDFVRSFAENAGVADAFSVSDLVNESDAAGVADSVALVAEFARVLPESVSIADVIVTLLVQPQIPNLRGLRWSIADGPRWQLAVDDAEFVVAEESQFATVAVAEFSVADEPRFELEVS